MGYNGRPTSCSVPIHSPPPPPPYRGERKSVKLEQKTQPKKMAFTDWMMTALLFLPWGK